MEIAQLIGELDLSNYQPLRTPITRELPNKKKLQQNTYHRLDSVYRKYRVTSIGQVDFNKLIPKNGFIRNYINYAKSHIPSTTAYHILGALHLISQMIGNRVTIKNNLGKLLPNLYTIFLGESSTSYKSATLRMIKDILNTLQKDYHIQTKLPDHYSVESLIDYLKKQNHGYLYINEFVLLLKTKSKIYNNNLIPTLTDIFDYNETYTIYLKKHNCAIETIQKPSLSIMSASTYTWLLEEIEPFHILGGFLPRFLIAINNNLKNDYLMNRTTKITKEDIIQHLINIHKNTQQPYEVEHNKDVLNYWYQWRKKIYSNLNYERKKELIAPFYARYTGEYPWKIALLIHIGNDTKSINNNLALKDMKYACNICEYYLKTVQWLIKNKIEVSKTRYIMKKVYQYIQHHQGCKRSQILREISNLEGTEHLTTILNNLEDEERIIIIGNNEYSYKAIKRGNPLNKHYTMQYYLKNKNYIENNTDKNNN